MLIHWLCGELRRLYGHGQGYAGYAGVTSPKTLESTFDSLPAHHVVVSLVIVVINVVATTNHIYFFSLITFI